MEEILRKAQKEINKIDIGITWGQLKVDKSLHNNIYYDKFGFSWSVKNGVLMYSDSHYKIEKKALGMCKYGRL